MTPEEFRKVILPEGRRLYALAFRFLNNREEAEDAVQEVMMRLWEDRTKLGNYANTAAWATTVTRNMCIDLLRKRKKMSHEDIDSVIISGRSDEVTLTASDSREAATLISGIVERMKEPYRSAVILRDMEGYSYEEAASVLQISVETLRTTLSRARKSIREQLKKIYSYGTGRD